MVSWFVSLCILSDESRNIGRGIFSQRFFYKGLILSFDVEFRKELHNYGYIFRFILDDEVSFDLVANFSESSKSLTLIEDERIFLSFPQNILKNYGWNKWMNIIFRLSPNEVAIELDGKGLSTTSGFYSKFKKCKIYFGVSEHEKFNSHDLPPMSIKDIKVSDSQSKLIAHWPLKQHLREEVYDSVKKLRAKTLNAVWETDQHTRWKKERDFRLPRYTQVAYNEKENCIYLVYMSTFYKYHLSANRVDTIEVKRGNPYHEKNNQLIYNPYYEELWSYDLDLNLLSIFNEKTEEWSQNDIQKKSEFFTAQCFYFPGRFRFVYFRRLWKCKRKARVGSSKLL